MNASVTTLDDSDVAAVEAKEKTPEASELVKHSDDLSGNRMILTIHPEQGPAGNHAVFIGLNGFGYQVPRGKPFNVPAELVENLSNAQVTHYERDDAGREQERKSPRFGFSALPAQPVGKALEQLAAQAAASQAAAAKTTKPAAK